MATIKIRNSITGETKEIDSKDLGGYGLNQSSVTTQNQPSQQSTTPLIDALGKTGIGATAFGIPVLGGILRGAANAGESYGRMIGGAGFEGARAVNTALGAKNLYYNPQTKQDVNNPFLPQGDPLLNAQTAGPEALGRTINAGLNVSTVKGLLGIPATAKALSQSTLADILKSPTWNKATAARDEILAKLEPNYNTVMEYANKIAKDAPVTVKNALNEMLGAEEPFSKSAAQNIAGKNIPENLRQSFDRTYTPTTQVIPNSQSPLTRADLNYLRINKAGNTIIPQEGPLSSAQYATENPTTPLYGGEQGQLAAPKWTSQQALELRQALGKRVPESNWDTSKYTAQTQADAAKIFYQAINEHLQDLAQKQGLDLKAADKVLSLYSKRLPFLGKYGTGDVPTRALEIGGGIIGEEILRNLLKGVRGRSNY